MMDCRVQRWLLALWLGTLLLGCSKRPPGEPGDAAARSHAASRSHSRATPALHYPNRLLQQDWAVRPVALEFPAPPVPNDALAELDGEQHSADAEPEVAKEDAQLDLIRLPEVPEDDGLLRIEVSDGGDVDRRARSSEQAEEDELADDGAADVAISMVIEPAEPVLIPNVCVDPPRAEPGPATIASDEATTTRDGAKTAHDEATTAREKATIARDQFAREEATIVGDEPSSYGADESPWRRSRFSRVEQLWQEQALAHEQMREQSAAGDASAPDDKRDDHASKDTITTNTLAGQPPAPEDRRTHRFSRFSESDCREESVRQLPAEAAAPATTTFAVRRLPPVTEPAARLRPPRFEARTPAQEPVEAVAQNSAERTSDDEAMRAVQVRTSAMIAHAFGLARRGAHYSARAELIEVLRTLTQALDMHGGGPRHSEALARAFRAMREAEDFQPRGAALEANLDMQMLVDGHETPVLHDADASRISPLQALQRYYTYAQEQLIIAGGGQPGASLALYGLGRLQTIMQGRSAGLSLEQPKAVVFHQAAMMVDPANYKAANELGVLLARWGQYAKARDVLIHSVRVAPRPRSWQNLAKVHEQLQEHDLARRALYEAQLAARGAAGDDRDSPVRWVDPQVLADQRPRTEGELISAPSTEPEPAETTSTPPSLRGLMKFVPWIREQ